MKVKMINRTERECTKRRAGEAHRVFHNPDPLLHPFQHAQELKRAVNAAKLERIFAKPFLSAFSHADAVTALSVNPKRLNCLLSGSADGRLCQWDLANSRCLRLYVGHSGAVKGIGVTPDGDGCISCAGDGTVKLWKLSVAPFEEGQSTTECSSVMDFPSMQSYRCLDHHWRDMRFAAGSSVVEIWDHHRSRPVMQLTWGCDSVTAVRFNPVEVELLGGTSTDRSVVLYDLRTRIPIRKVVMQTRSNALSWNPMEAMTFVCANEDANLYTYDMRRLDAAQTVHKAIPIVRGIIDVTQGFVSAVMDVDFDPTGSEFAAAGFDRTVRLFEKNASGSRDVYFAPRMSRVTCLRFSRDGTYVFSGSEDMNVRMWKARASEQLGIQLPQERRRQSYHSAIVDRYRNVEAVRKVKKSLRVPRPIYKAQKIRRIIQENDKKKRENLRKNSKPGTVARKPERKKKIVGTLE